MIDFDIVRLTKDHNVLAFDCGNKVLQDYYGINDEFWKPEDNS